MTLQWPPAAPGQFTGASRPDHCGRIAARRSSRRDRIWRGPEPGGHFLALEQPARLIRDLRDFCRPLRVTAAGDRGRRE